MSKINYDMMVIPSSLKVYPTLSWYAGDLSIPVEYQHLRTQTCPICNGWQSTEEVMVWKPETGAVRRTVVRCHGNRERNSQRCRPTIVNETPMDKYEPSLQ